MTATASNNLAHQDWQQVVFKKRPPPPPKPNLEPKHIREAKQDCPESFQTKYFEPDFVKHVIQKRLEKKMTQKDLAVKMCVDVAVINRLEQGRELYNAVLKSKLKKILG